MALDKCVGSAAAAVADIADGASIAVGGFGLCGVPAVLIQALYEQGTTHLRVVSNNCGVDEWGLGVLLSAKRIARTTSSYVGENKEFERQFLSGELEVELTPQGTLAEKLRAGGAGIPAFYTATGVGTQVADGGLPWRYAPDGSVPSPPRRRRPGETSTADVRAGGGDHHRLRAGPGRKGDRHGNLVFHETARNFNPLAAMAGPVTIAEVERLVEPGEIDPDRSTCPASTSTGCCR
jgi:3-oxoacid CoA-transferase subunit A